MFLYFATLIHLVLFIRFNFLFPNVLQQLLPQKLLEENRARNIPALTPNQLAVIYKLIWYQDGYEQPSEEDLKRIMIVSIFFSISIQLWKRE